MIASIFTIAWGIYTLIWFIVCLLRYHKLKKVRSILNRAEADLDMMSSILNKFKKGEVPLDKSIIEAHMRMFESVEKSFEAKMELYNKIYSK